MRRESCEAEPDQRPGPVAPAFERRRRDRVLLAFVRHHDRRDEVDQQAGAAEQGEHDEADAIERGVDLEVVRQAPADAGEHTIRAAALQPLGRGFFDCVCVHEPRIARAHPHGYPE
jgi:hypothetical protein